MQLRHIILLALLGLFVGSSHAGRYDKVLLSKVKTLTLRNDQVTTARRLSPIPQLKCIGGDGNGFYEIDVMLCTNMGSDYGDENISWSCAADVPKYFKLGSTDVLCEGYDNPDDRYILKGSCGVEYRLALTDAGYEKYGGSFSKAAIASNEWWPSIFTIIFWCVVAVIIYGAYNARNNPQEPVRRRPGTGFNNGRPWFGGGDDNDPPPPYNPQPPRYKTTSSQQGWQPGFWSGMAAGAAGTYMMGNRNRDNTRYGGRHSRGSSSLGSAGSGFAEGSSAGTSRHETTGFGQTRRR